jgi:hypothetical protein
MSENSLVDRDLDAQIDAEWADIGWIDPLNQYAMRGDASGKPRGATDYTAEDAEEKLSGLGPPSNGKARGGRCECGECPSQGAHERWMWHRDDRWGRRKAAEEEVTDDGSSWDEADIADAEDLLPRSILDIGDGVCLLRPDEVATIFGPSGSGKTPLAYIAGVQVVKAGGLWLIIDFEMGLAEARNLLMELGLSKAEIKHGVHFVDDPMMLNDVGMQHLLDGVLGKMDRTGRDLRYVTWDSQNRSMAKTPFPNSNDNTDVACWFISHPHRVRREFQGIGLNPAHVVIDHTNNDEGKRPGGAHTKTDNVETQIRLKNLEPFDRTHEDGCSELSYIKLRGGDRAKGKPLAELHTTLGGSFHLTPPKDPKTESGKEDLNLDFGKLGTSGRKSKLEWDMIVQTKLVEAGTKGIAQSAVLGSGSGRNPRAAALARLFKGGRAARRATSSGTTWWDIGRAPNDAETRSRS